MNVIVKNGDPSQRKDIRSLVKFASALLFKGSKVVDDLSLKVQLVEGLFLEEQINGDLIWEDREYRSREFFMRIDSSLKRRTLLETVAHEMVHLKQFAKGEFKTLDGHKIRFQKKTYSLADEYWDSPWEIEAFGRERGIIERWLDFQGYNMETRPDLFELVYL